MDKKMLLIWTEEDRETILKIYGRTVETVKDDVKIISDWMKLQKHLPAVLTDIEIERFLCINKFHFEKTKSSTDMYYTIRSMVPELFLKNNVRNPLIQNTADVYYSFPLPFLFNNLRITCFKIIDPDPSNFNPLVVLARDMCFGTIRLLEDYDEGQINVVDLHGITLTHALKFTPRVMKIMTFVMEHLYSNNCRGIHFLNAPYIAEYFLGLLKYYVAPKIFDRINIHKNLESLHKHIPVEYLPVEMGGFKFTLKELNEKWITKLDSYFDIFTHLDNLIPDENLRPIKLKDNFDNAFGIDGHFRKLNVD